MTKQYIDRDFQAMLFAHTRGLKMGSRLEKSTKSRPRSKAHSTSPVGARGYAASRVSSPSSKRSKYASPNRGLSRSARRGRKGRQSPVGNYVPDYCSPYIESSEDVASTVRRGRSAGRASSAATTEETFSQVSLHSPTRNKRSQRAVSDRPLGEGEASTGHKDKYFRLRDKVKSLKKELSRIQNSRLTFTAERLKQDIAERLEQDIAEVRAARNKAERRIIADRERYFGQRPGDNGEYVHEPFGTSSDASVQGAGAAESSGAAAARATHRDERQRYDIVITVVDAGPVIGLCVNNNLGRELRTLVRYQDKYGATWHEKLKVLSPKGETRRRRQQEAARVNAQHEIPASRPINCETQLPRRSAQAEATPGNVQEPHSGMDYLPPGWRPPNPDDQLHWNFAQRAAARRNVQETHSGMDYLPPSWRFPSRGNQLRDRYAELNNRQGKTPREPEGSGRLNATNPRRWEHVVQINSVTDAVTTKPDGRDKGKGKAKLLVHEDGGLGLPIARPEVQSVTKDDTKAVKGEGEDKGKGKGKAKATSTPPATENAASSMNSDGTPVLTPAASVDDVERADADVAREVKDEFDFGKRTPLGEFCEW